MPSALRDVRSALHSLYVDTFGGTSTQVFNGPRSRSGAPKRYLLVGVNGIEELEAGMRSEQTVSSLSGEWRDETGEIDCTVIAWTGGTDMDEIREQAETIVAACENAVNADPSLGGLLTLHSNRAEMTRLDIREQQTTKGSFVEAVFTVSYATVLTS